LFKCPAKLVGTRCVLRPAAYAVYFVDNIVDVLATNQLTYSLQVAMAASQKENLLNNVVFVGRHVNKA
jgi:hypothetical protein